VKHAEHMKKATRGSEATGRTSRRPSPASDEQTRVHAEGLRRVAVASVAALAVVLALAVATASSEHGGDHHGNAGHSATHSDRADAARTGAGD
jgi:hypothetical protein